jgi:cytochrome c556
MKVPTVALALAVAVAAGGYGVAMAQDALQVIEKRQDAMKAQGRATAAIKNYTDG